jgi:hypothetical protein
LPGQIATPSWIDTTGSDPGPAAKAPEVPVTEGTALAPGGGPAAKAAEVPMAEARPYQSLTPSTGLLAGGAPAPTVGPTTGTLAADPAGFNHTPFPTYAAPVDTYAAPAAPAPAAPTAPAEVAMRQIWQPQGGNMTASQWLAANPNWETDFNRAEQRADGTWWVPQDPNAPRPAGPQYYQGTGNVTYGGSVGIR